MTVEKSVLLDCPPERAFTIFTERASEWWPGPLRHTDDPTSEIRMLPTGRFWERSAAGREVELGHVRVWDPPRRLAFDFYPGTDQAHPTAVVVTFVAEDGGTRVSIEHGPTAASDQLWTQRSPRFARSWDLVLAALARTATG